MNKLVSWASLHHAFYNFQRHLLVIECMSIQRVCKTSEGQSVLIILLWIDESTLLMLQKPRCYLVYHVIAIDHPNNAILFSLYPLIYIPSQTPGLFQHKTARFYDCARSYISSLFRNLATCNTVQVSKSVMIHKFAVSKIGVLNFLWIV